MPTCSLSRLNSIYLYIYIYVYKVKNDKYNQNFCYLLAFRALSHTLEHLSNKIIEWLSVGFRVAHWSRPSVWAGSKAKSWQCQGIKIHKMQGWHCSTGTKIRMPSVATFLHICRKNEDSAFQAGSLECLLHFPVFFRQNRICPDAHRMPEFLHLYIYIYYIQYSNQKTRLNLEIRSGSTCSKQSWCFKPRADVPSIQLFQHDQYKPFHLATDWNIECLRRVCGKSGGWSKTWKKSPWKPLSAYLQGKWRFGVQRVSLRTPSQMISNCDASISERWENISIYSICILPVFFQTKPHGPYAHRMPDSSHIYINMYLFNEIYIYVYSYLTFI